jgi:enoyl-CoA hydratase
MVGEDGPVLLVTIDRPEVRNAVDEPTAQRLHDVFVDFDRDDARSVAVLSGSGDAFCAGADLKALAAGRPLQVETVGGRGPMGPTRLRLSKPVVAAIEGPAVGGGLELALWCDLRVASRSAYFGVFNRRFGVPLIDLGTVRLSRIVGQGRALDLILSGRKVEAEEALAIGIVNRLCEDGAALEVARQLAHELARFPQAAMRGDRLSALEQWGMGEDEAAANELRHGLRAIESGETERGAGAFSAGGGRHGARD